MPKKRVSLTLEEETVSRVDTEAENRNINRSQLVGEIVESYFKRKGVNTAVVLCGDPELKTLKLYNGQPVLAHILDHLEEEGVTRVILLVGKNNEIEENFGTEYKGIGLEYVSEEEPRGTAAAIKRVEDRINDRFAVLNGHVIADVDLQGMLEVHEEESSTATMSLTAVEDPSGYGVARLKGRSILGFVEKPGPGEEPSRLINAGTYIFDPEIFEILEHDDLEAVFEDLADDGELSGYIYGGKWREFDED